MRWPPLARAYRRVLFRCRGRLVEKMKAAHIGARAHRLNMRGAGPLPYGASRVPWRARFFYGAVGVRPARSRYRSGLRVGPIGLAKPDHLGQRTRPRKPSAKLVRPRQGNGRARRERTWWPANRFRAIFSTSLLPSGYAWRPANRFRAAGATAGWQTRGLRQSAGLPPFCGRHVRGRQRPRVCADQDQWRPVKVYLKPEEHQYPLLPHQNEGEFC